jgi:hypothetical protein
MNAEDISSTESENDRMRCEDNESSISGRCTERICAVIAIAERDGVERAPIFNG